MIEMNSILFWVVIVFEAAVVFKLGGCWRDAAWITAADFGAYMKVDGQYYEVRKKR